MAILSLMNCHPSIVLVHLYITLETLSVTCQMLGSYAWHPLSMASRQELNKKKKLVCAFCRGDIVIAHSPTNPRQYICKRVVAMEGDRVFVPKNDAHSLVSISATVKLVIFCVLPKGYVSSES